MPNIPGWAWLLGGAGVVAFIATRGNQPSGVATIASHVSTDTASGSTLPPASVQSVASQVDGGGTLLDTSTTVPVTSSSSIAVRSSPLSTNISPVSIDTSPVTFSPPPAPRASFQPVRTPVAPVLVSTPVQAPAPVPVQVPSPAPAPAPVPGLPPSFARFAPTAFSFSRNRFRLSGPYVRVKR